VLIIIDQPEQVREFLAQVQELVTEGVITLDEVEVAR
jgi:uncharacterized protein